MQIIIFIEPNFTLNCSVDYVKLKMFAYVIMDTHFIEKISNCGASLTRRNFTEVSAVVTLHKEVFKRLAYS